MEKRRPEPDPAEPRRVPVWAVVASIVVLLGAAGWLDALTGPRTTFTLAYLAPVAIATAFFGTRAGIGTAVVATAIALGVALSHPASLSAECWNAGARFGVFVVVCQLVDRAGGARVASRILRVAAVGLAAAGALAGIGALIQRHLEPDATDVRVFRSLSVRTRFAEIESRLDAAVRAGRPVLLGSRNPDGQSCITPVRSGDVHDRMPQLKGDLDGGPGTKRVVLQAMDRRNVTRPMEDFRWHQTRLRAWLENELVLDASAAASADELARVTRRFADEVATWTSAEPRETSLVGTRGDDWPHTTLVELDHALVRGDVGAIQRWSNELAAASFALADLHRWLQFLCRNELAALDFQADCKSLFESTERELRTYDPDTSLSALPGGILSNDAFGNYVELERQAEWLFAARETAASSDPELARSGGVEVFPAVRKAYHELRAALSTDNRATWEEAARTPFEHSYLVNMLYRASTSGATKQLGAVLRRFDALRPHATIAELMGVLMYRGDSYAGIEWSDRWVPQLMSAADEIPPSASDVDALMSAARWTSRLHAGPETYASTYTLRDALSRGRIDCVRATDMIGAIFRNSGRTRFGNVRWTAGTAAHSVAAYVAAGASGEAQPVVVDGLDPSDAPESFPSCYFSGHRWPRGLEGNPSPFAAELYVRGLDNYVWAEGYVVRGPNAGWLSTTAIPYSSSLKTSGKTKVYAGPAPN